jgi:hypothetical protein
MRRGGHGDRAAGGRVSDTAAAMQPFGALGRAGRI